MLVPLQLSAYCAAGGGGQKAVRASWNVWNIIHPGIIVGSVVPFRTDVWQSSGPAAGLRVQFGK